MKRLILCKECVQHLPITHPLTESVEFELLNCTHNSVIWAPALPFLRKKILFYVNGRFVCGKIKMRSSGNNKPYLFFLLLLACGQCMIQSHTHPFQNKRKREKIQPESFGHALCICLERKSGI